MVDRVCLTRLVSVVIMYLCVFLEKNLRRVLGDTKWSIYDMNEAQ